MDVTICEALAMDQPIVTLGRTPASNSDISSDSVHAVTILNAMCTSLELFFSISRIMYNLGCNITVCYK